MSGRHDAAIAENQGRIDRVHHLRIGNRVDLVEPDDFRVSSQTNEIPAPDDVQMTDAHVVFDDQLLHTRDDIQVSDRYVVVDFTFACIDDAQTDANSFADPVAKEPAVEGAL